jgi:hypothetical protein
MTLKVIPLLALLILVAQPAIADDAGPKIADPIADYINKATLCTNSNEQILRITEDSKLWLSTDNIVGMKVGQWQLYTEEQGQYSYAGSEPRANGEWMWNIERCACSEATKNKCAWQKWREP